MTKETVKLRQAFRSNLHFLNEFFETELAKDIQSGDHMTQLAMEKTVNNAYPFVIDVSNDMFTDDKVSFETHLISFLYFQTIDAASNIRIYYGVGHRCDFDKGLSSIGLSSSHNVTIYAVVLENTKVLSITARQIEKNKAQFEKSAPLFMCSYSYLPPTPLLLEDSGYLDSFYSNVTKETKRFKQTFTAMLEGLNTTIAETTSDYPNYESTHTYFLSYLLTNENTAHLKDTIAPHLLIDSEDIDKSLNALTFTPNAGIRRGLHSHSSKEFIYQQFEELREKARTPAEKHTVDLLKSHFARQSGIESGPLKLDQIIRKPIHNASKASTNEYDVKDPSTRPFSATRIQPISTLLTDQQYEIANSYQGAKDEVKVTDWSSTAFPMLIVEPVTKQAHKHQFQCHFIAFTVKESYTKAINANTMFRYLGYGYPFFFNGAAFQIDDTSINVYGFIQKKKVFTSFSQIDYLSFYDQLPTSTSLIGKRPSNAIETKSLSATTTLSLAVKNRKQLIESCNEALVEINASYNRYLKKNKKQSNPKTALEYISNMILRTAKETYEFPILTPATTPNLEECDTTTPNNTQQQNESHNSDDIPTSGIKEAIDPQAATDKAPLEGCVAPIDVDQTENIVNFPHHKPIEAEKNQENISDENSPKTIFIHQNINNIVLTPIIESNLAEKPPYEVVFTHTPDCTPKNMSEDEVQSIINLTKSEPKPESENRTFKIDRTETSPSTTNDLSVDENNCDENCSLISNLSVQIVDWFEIKGTKYKYKELNIALSKKKLYIQEPATNDALFFKTKSIINKSDDYYYLKRVVGKNLANELRRFLKLKLDHTFLEKFTQA